jgi:serine/threonine-protein kinase RsbW
MYSAVAVTDDGNFMGHCALFRWDATQRIAELGLGVVKPEYRSQGVFSKLNEHLVNQARSQDLIGITRKKSKYKILSGEKDCFDSQFLFQ